MSVFLHIDTFDPHEPWLPPKYYVDLYGPGFTGEEVICPHYGSTDILSTAELHQCRALYAAEITIVDRWLGKLLQTVDDLGLRKSTATIFISDRGFVLGEHGWIGKETFPLYEVLNHVPLLIRIPAMAPGQVISGYAPAADLMPTILDLCGVPEAGGLHGHSLLPMLLGATEQVREVCISTTSLATPMSGNGSQAELRTMIRRPGWAMLYGPQVEPLLFDTTRDPNQEHNVYDLYPGIAGELHASFDSFQRDVGAPDKVMTPVANDGRFQENQLQAYSPFIRTLPR